jgi:hypothetical protein
VSHHFISFEDHLFGRVAVSLDLMTPEQLRECMKRLRAERNGRSLARLTVAEGLLDEENVASIRRIQRKKACRMLRPECLEEDEQALGAALIDEGMVGLDGLEGSLLEKQRLVRRHVHVHLGEVLINRGVLGEEDVRRILRRLRGEIRRCERCDLNLHVGPDVPEARWLCPQCGLRLQGVRYLQLIEADGGVR